MLVLLFAAIHVPHHRDMDSSALPGGALWYCKCRGLVSTDQTLFKSYRCSTRIRSYKSVFVLLETVIKVSRLLNARCWNNSSTLSTCSWNSRSLFANYFFIWSCWFWGNLQRSYPLGWSLKLPTEISVVPVSSGSTFIQSEFICCFSLAQ